MSNTKKILLIDDDSDFLESMHLMLIDEGYNVLTVTNGNDVVQKYEEFKPDIVILDVKMPIIDGYEAFLRIKKHDGDARIVFTSGYAFDDLKYEGIQDKSRVGLMNKPIEITTVKKMIRKYAR